MAGRSGASKAAVDANWTSSTGKKTTPETRALGSARTLGRPRSRAGRATSRATATGAARTSEPVTSTQPIVAVPRAGPATLLPNAGATQGPGNATAPSAAPTTSKRRSQRRPTGNQSNASVKAAPAIARSSSNQQKTAGSSITSTIAPRDGPSLQPDQGADMKTKPANHTCKRAATASGRLSRYFI